MPTTAAFGDLLAPSARPSFAETIDVDSLHDLALDQVLDSMQRTVTDPAALADVFRRPLHDVDAVRYRQGVFAALEHTGVRSAVSRFVDALVAVRSVERDAGRSRYPLQQARLHLSAVLGYCEAVHALAQDLLAALDAAEVKSIGLRGFAEHADRLRQSPPFRRLEQRARELDADWGSILFALLIRDGTLHVAPFDDEASLEDEVDRVFERFRRGQVEDHHSRLRQDQTLDHIQAWILDAVGALKPDVLQPLMAWSQETPDFVDDVLARSVAQSEFYFAYLDLVAPLRAAGLHLTCPDVSLEHRRLELQDVFDLPLARARVADGARVVTNDLALRDGESALVITGPNQGGKTTTARLIGQVHHLAALGCPVPGSSARLRLPDRVMTCFDRAERLETLEGRMGEEVQRIRTVLDRATANTVVILNEVFSSTALRDATVINREVLTRLLDVGALTVCVTFIDELSRLDPAIVSLVAAVDPDDPAVRTFKLERRRADGRAYAEALAHKHGLTRDRLRERIAGAEGTR
ncbi:MutS-related protein [Amnibacterium sp.]|uniref:MutS-related protein n=1 Tax=Amnibacterium sp. TaxID=1872496 RepID=UPI003F7BB0B9